MSGNRPPHAADEVAHGVVSPGQPAWEPVDPFPGSGRVRTVTVFPDGSLWAAGDRWVAHSPDGGETWERVGTGEGLGEDIGALVQGEDGKIWAGAYGGGVSVWDGARWHALQP